MWGITDGNGPGLNSVHSQTIHDVEQSLWLKILEQMGYGKYVLIEVPVPNESEFPQAKDALANIQSAQKFLFQGHYAEAVGTCRKVIEALRADLHLPTLSMKKEFQDFLINTRKLGKKERFILMLRAFELFCHPTHHFDENSKNIEWKRTDATMAISICSQLVSWLTTKNP